MFKEVTKTVAGANICSAVGRETTLKSRVSTRKTTGVGKNRGMLIAVMILIFATLVTSCENEENGVPYNRTPIKAVTLNGKLQVGETLTATALDDGGNVVSNAEYQWKRGTSSSSYQSNYSNITGATGKTYTLTTADIGKYIAVYAENSVTDDYDITYTYSAFTYCTNIVRPAESEMSTLTADTWKDGQILSTATEQWYKFTATAATHYLHISRGSVSELYVQLYESDGSKFGDYIYSGTSYGSTNRATLSVVSGRTYYIRVYQCSSYTGTYKIAFNSNLQAPGTITTATTLTEDTWVNGQITATANVFWYKFTATAATQYIHIDVGTFSSYLYVQLYDGDGSTIGSASSFSSDGYKTLSVVSGQTYYFTVSSSGTGTYKIAFNSLMLPPGTISAATELTADTWTTGAISTTDTEDWYKFTATADKQYIHVKRGSLNSLYVQFYESTGSTLGSGVYFSGSPNPYYTSLSGVSGQTYYIRVYQYSSYTGTYQITFNATTAAPEE
jgi:hypothetical protein